MINNIMRSLLNYYRKISIIIGIIISIVCYLMITDANILNDPLSRFGIEPQTKEMWILFNQLMALSLLSSGIESNKIINNLLYKKILNYLLYTSLICFSLSGFITMDIRYIHLSLAAAFFLLYLGYIFWYGIFSRIKRITALSSIIVLLCVLSLIITIILKISYGVFEVIFILSVIIWNYIMIYKK